ncbi:hypothetical protein HMPREF9621_02798 [Cutibacterium modestum HL037PA2]|nr:hypothetical protein HMPREF9621_02798 [Cutibacterium modestum HL037PA2]
MMWTRVSWIESQHDGERLPWWICIVHGYGNDYDEGSPPI